MQTTGGRVNSPRPAADSETDEFLKVLLTGPSMNFDESLLQRVDCGGVEIPLPVGMAFVMLRRKHSEEMCNEPFYSFLQDANFDCNIVSEMEDKELNSAFEGLLSPQLTESECASLLEKFDASALCRIIYHILRRLTAKPYPICGRSCDIIASIDLLDDYDPVMRGHLRFWEKELIGWEYETPESFQTPQITDACRKTLIREKINVWQWRHERVRAMNMLNSCLLVDQMMVGCSKTRNLLRFVLANLVELIRSYIRKAYEGELLPNDEMLHVVAMTLHPTEVKRAICRLAKAFGRLLFRLELDWMTNKVRQYPYVHERMVWAWERAARDMQAHILKNILCINFENFWNPRKSTSEKMIHDSNEATRFACACRFFEDPTLP